MTRQRLPNRRASQTFDVQAQGLKFTATVSRFADGNLAEVFLQNHRAGSAAGILANDAAVAASLALQFGCPVDVLRKRSGTKRLSTRFPAKDSDREVSRPSKRSRTRNSRVRFSQLLLNQVHQHHSNSALATWR